MQTTSVVDVMQDPWATQQLGSQEAVAEYLQSYTTHYKRTQERAQNLLDFATYAFTVDSSVGTTNTDDSSPSKGLAKSEVNSMVMTVEQQLNSLAVHAQYKVRLDGLRFIFQSLSKAAEKTLKRPAVLIQWLCAIVTYAPSAGDSTTAGADPQALLARAHPLRGKALAVIALLLRHAKPQLQTSSIVAQVPARMGASVDELAATLAVVFAMSLLPQLLTSTATATATAANANANATAGIGNSYGLMGSVLLHQCVEVLETLGEADSQHLTALGTCGFAIMCDLTARAPLMTSSLGEALLPRVHVDLAKALAMSAETHAELYNKNKKQSTRDTAAGAAAATAEATTAAAGPEPVSLLAYATHGQLSSGATLYIEQMSKLASAQTAVSATTYQQQLTSAAEAIAELTRSSSVHHDAFQAAFHSLISVITLEKEHVLESAEAKEEYAGAGVIHTLMENMTNLFIADVISATASETGSDTATDAVEGNIAAYPMAVRRIEARVGLLSSLWDADASAGQNDKRTSLKSRADYKDKGATASAVQLLSLIQACLKRGLASYGRTREGKPDKSSGLTTNDRTEMRIACADCRTGCIAAAQDLLSRYTAQEWIIRNDASYFKLCLQELGGPTLLVPGYAAFKNASLPACEGSETAGTDAADTKRTECAANANKIIKHIISALRDAEKYTLPAALDIVRAAELLAQHDPQVLLLWWTAQDVAVPVPSLAVMLLNCYGSDTCPKSSASAATKEEDDEEEPIAMQWHVTVLSALMNIVKYAPESEFVALRATLGGLLQFLVNDLQDIIAVTGISLFVEEKEAEQNGKAVVKETPALSQAEQHQQKLNTKMREKRILRRFGVTGYEELQRVMECCGAALIAILTKFTGDAPVKDTRTRMYNRLLSGNEPVEVRTCAYSLFQRCEVVAKQRQQQQETYSKEDKYANTEHDANMSAKDGRLTEILSSEWHPCDWIFPMETLLLTLCSIAGRVPTFDNDALQQCLELDIIRAITIALSQLFFPNIEGTDEHLVQRWVGLMQKVSEAAIKASGIQLVYSYHDQILLHSSLAPSGEGTGKNVSNLKAKLKKCVSIYSTLYTYAREAILAVGECIEIMIPNDKFLPILYQLLPAQLNEVAGAFTVAITEVQPEVVPSKNHDQILLLTHIVSQLQMLS